jgi:enoyl-CoA hydratase/carnithine racemase
MAEILAIKRAPEGPVFSVLENGILHVTLARPPANALSISAMASLQAEFDRARDDKAFSALAMI